MPITDVLKADAIILSHIHEDHWDPAARYLVPRTMTIFTQDEKDAAKVREDGFTDVRVLTEEGLDFKGTRLIKLSANTAATTSLPYLSWPSFSAT